MVDRHFPKLHVKLVLSTASSVYVHQHTVTASIERTRWPTTSTLPLPFLYVVLWFPVTEYQAFPLSVCNIEKLVGAWEQGYYFHTHHIFNIMPSYTDIV